MNRRFPTATEPNIPLTKKLCLLVFVVLFVGCSAIQPVETAGPRSNQPAYPIVFTGDPHRAEAVIGAISSSMNPGSPQPADVRLEPIVATVRSISSDPAHPLYLPKLGAKPQMTEEETREAMRRFLSTWTTEIGAAPNELSLVGWEEKPNQTTLATYEQRPFRYPLKGNYGKLFVEFAADDRILQLSSTCIPATERLKAAMSNITPTVKPEDAVKFVQQNEIQYQDNNGSMQRFKVSTSTKIDIGELVIYALPTKSQTIEFHLAWAINLTDAPVKTVYLDAVNASVIAAA